MLSLIQSAHPQLLLNPFTPQTHYPTFPCIVIPPQSHTPHHNTQDGYQRMTQLGTTANDHNNFFMGKKEQLTSNLRNNKNTLTIKLTETHLNEKILDSEIQMRNYIRFRADRTLGRKNGSVMTCIKATEAVDADQLIAKSNSYLEYQLIRIQNRNIVIINVAVLQTAQQKNLPAP